MKRFRAWLFPLAGVAALAALVAGLALWAPLGACRALHWVRLSSLTSSCAAAETLAAGRAAMERNAIREALGLFREATRRASALAEARSFLEARVGRDVRQGATPAVAVEPRGRVVVDPKSVLAGAEQAFAAGRYPDALSEARRAAGAMPSSVPALTAHAAMAEFMGEFDEAQTAYAAAAALAPDQPDLLYRRASFAVRTGDYDGALALLDRVLASQPREARWLFAWAPSALQSWTIRRYPALEHLVQMRVDILMEKGDLAQARAVARRRGIVNADSTCTNARQRPSDTSTDATFRAFRLAALGDPGAADCVWWYGQWLTDAGYIRLGRLMVQEAWRVAPSQGNKDSAARYLRVRLGGTRDVPKRAEQLFQIAVQRYRRDGDADGARRLFEQAVALAPGFVRPHAYLANLALDDGDEAGAVVWFERAVASDDASWRTRHDLGRLLDRLERYAEAETHLRKAIELFGDDIGGRLDLARVLYAQGKHDEYATLTRSTVAFAQSFGARLPEVREFLDKFERWGPGATLPPAPDPALILGWNHD
jgi:tetratricopeptide (TPR) repeat protein